MTIHETHVIVTCVLRQMHKFNYCCEKCFPVFFFFFCVRLLNSTICPSSESSTSMDSLKLRYVYINWQIYNYIKYKVQFIYFSSFQCDRSSASQFGLWRCMIYIPIPCWYSYVAILKFQVDNVTLSCSTQRDERCPSYIKQVPSISNIRQLWRDENVTFPVAYLLIEFWGKCK